VRCLLVAVCEILREAVVRIEVNQMKHEVKMVRAVRMVWVCSSFLALLSCVHGVGGPIDTVAAADSPNVIVIFVDDQGYYDLGCYGAT